MIVYRITKARYANDLSGGGAQKAGGRWNSKGYAVLYTSQSRALSAIEFAVHLPPGIIPPDYKIISLEIPDEFEILEIETENLPIEWKRYPYHPFTQKIGNDWLDGGKQLIMKVPSVVVESEFNFLINPAHPSFSEVKITDIRDFSFDLRLIR